MRTPYLSLADAVAICRETAELAPGVAALEPFRPHVPATSAPSPIAVTKAHPATG
jgi:S-DNA-T family DNA segregation ATPase FtsK/SpoIIIE